MSATLDSTLFAAYFGGCPVLTAAGRTFPVEQLYLEDIYEAIGYVLAPDSPCAFRSGGDRRAARMQKMAAQRSQHLVKVIAC